MNKTQMPYDAFRQLQQENEKLKRERNKILCDLRIVLNNQSRENPYSKSDEWLLHQMWVALHTPKPTRHPTGKFDWLGDDGGYMIMKPNADEMESRISHAQRILEEFKAHQDNEDEMDRDMGALEPDKTSYPSGMIRRAISALNGSHRATTSDGCGNSWETPCSKCGEEFEVIRPGKVQCGC